MFDILFVILFFLMLADGFLTVKILKQDGNELNPLVKALLKAFPKGEAMIISRAAGVVLAITLFVAYPLGVVPLIAWYAYIVYRNYRNMV
jgi:hypothetical protein